MPRRNGNGSRNRRFNQLLDYLRTLNFTGFRTYFSTRKWITKSLKTIGCLGLFALAIGTLFFPLEFLTVLEYVVVVAAAASAVVFVLALIKSIVLIFVDLIVVFGCRILVLALMIGIIIGIALLIVLLFDIPMQDIKPMLDPIFGIFVKS